MSRMPMFSRGELHEVEVTTPEAKLAIGRYWGDAINRFLATGDISRLQAYKGQAILGLPFEVDPDVIEDWYASTDFDFQEIYER
jgi:hypothetical protein